MDYGEADEADATDENSGKRSSNRFEVRRKHLEAASWTVAIGAALFPVVGYSIRYLAFSVSQLKVSPSTVAASASVSELAATGASNILGPGLALILFFGVYLVKEARRTHQRREIRQRIGAAPLSLRAVILPLTVVGLVMLVGPGLFQPNFPSWIIIAVTGFVASAINRYLVVNSRSFSATQLILPLVVVLLGATVYGSLEGNMPGVDSANYTFASTTRIPNGNYQQLGGDNGLVYLRSCSHPREVLEVSTGAIDRIALPQTETVINNPSLWSIITRHKQFTIGLPTC